ncbi:MAG: UvrD-helicase domain-containing protein, partial [Clostridia bacterium]|nr:UvrD-helicase domain-containing protein [Clostridia bacterium]
VALGIDKYAAYLKNMREAAFAAANAASPEELYAAAGYAFEKMPTVQTKGDEEKARLNAYIKFSVKVLKGVFADICGVLFHFDGAGLEKYLSTARANAALCALTAEFDEKFAEYKREEGLIDFADIEHFTYKLLSRNPQIAEEVRGRYKYVFADEYQDINDAQEKILALLSKDNLFMVGDVKQSIYAFRGCDPDIFAKKAEEYSAGNGGKVISLDKNFRSTGKVLQVVNNIFSRVMTKDLGGIDYAANEMQGGDGFPEDHGGAVLHVADGKRDKAVSPSGVYDVIKDLEEKDDDEEFYEGATVAEIIRDEIANGTLVEKDGSVRRVNFGDVVVLTRTSTAYAAKVKRELARYGIPFSSEAGADIRDYPEIKLLIAVLKLVYFYADDVPLAATLKSAVGKLTEEQLAEIRRPYPRRAGKSFAECVEDYRVNGADEEIKSKLNAFSDYFGKIRLLSEYVGAGEILLKIMRETGLDLEIAAMSLGETRIKRVRRFISASAEGGKKLSVGEFLKKIEPEENEMELSVSAGEDTVRMMTIHASKGLEFPVVILAGVNSPFSTESERKEVLFDRREGFAFRYYDEENNVFGDTFQRKYFIARMRRERAKEQARLFYVALTRAEQRLHLVCGSAPAEEQSALTAPDAKKFKDYVSPDDMEIKHYAAEELSFGGKPVRENVLIGAGRETLTKKIAQYVDFEYPYGKDVILPVKRAVTKIAEESGETVAPLLPTSDVYGDEERVASYTEKGIAYHRFMEKCDLFDKNADDQLIALYSRGDLTKEQVGMLDGKALGRALSSSVFDEIKEYKLYREQAFIAPFPATEAGIADTDGEVLVQGVIDLLCIKDGEGIIVDYKTSHASAEVLRARYGEQLRLYAMAAEKTLGIKIKKKVLLNLLTGASVEV